jgi:hypothetical protein
MKKPKDTWHLRYMGLRPRYDDKTDQVLRDRARGAISPLGGVAKPDKPKVVVRKGR